MFWFEQRLFCSQYIFIFLWNKHYHWYQIYSCLMVFEKISWRPCFFKFRFSLKCINFAHFFNFFQTSALRICFLFYIWRLLLKGIKWSNKKTFYLLVCFKGLIKVVFCMPNFSDLSDYDYFLFDKGGNDDLYSNLKHSDVFK